MVNLVHDIPAGTVDMLNVIIEIPQDCRVKYELDKDTNLIKVDRINYTAMAHPTAYGFVPQTLCGDGDPLDVLVLVSEPLVPGCLLEVRPIGLLNMVDSGEADPKILGVAVKDPRYENVKDIKDVNPHLLQEISHFFKHYKDLQKKVVEVDGWENAEVAKKEVEKSFKLYKEQKK